MKGYFGIGVEGISKPMNAGNLFRSAHAFGANFVFAVAPHVDVGTIYRADTSQTHKNVPLYAWDSVAAMDLPKDCALVGVELLDEAIELPSFTHPTRAAYVLGPERGSLSAEMTAACDYVVKIPTRFCINLGVAGAVLMYDRVCAMGRFAPRPVKSGGPTEQIPAHVRGGQLIRNRGGG